MNEADGVRYRVRAAFWSKLIVARMLCPSCKRRVLLNSCQLATYNWILGL